MPRASVADHEALGGEALQEPLHGAVLGFGGVGVEPVTDLAGREAAFCPEEFHYREFGVGQRGYRHGGLLLGRRVYDAMSLC